MDEISYYAVIPANVRYDDDLTPNAKLLYGEVTALCNKNGYCWAKNTYFAELYKVSERSISKWINQLIEKGYLKSNIEYKKGDVKSTTRYLSIPVPSRRKVPEGGGGIEEKFQNPLEEKFQQNNTSINNKKEKTKKQTEFDVLINSYTENQKLKDTLYEFIKHRKAIKASLTTLALKKILNKLDNLADNDNVKIEILENSIMNGWRGVFALDKNNKVISMPKRNEIPVIPVEIDKDMFGGL